MQLNRKTVVVTGASRGIGAGVVKAFLARGYDVVGTARSATKSKELSASDHLALIDGDIGQFETAQKVAELATKKFGSIDAVVANAVAPGAVYTSLHRETPKDVMESLSPMGRPSTVKDITDAVMYLTDAATVTGHILYVDGGAHFGRW